MDIEISHYTLMKENANPNVAQDGTPTKQDRMNETLAGNDDFPPLDWFQFILDPILDDPIPCSPLNSNRSSLLLVKYQYLFYK